MDSERENTEGPLEAGNQARCPERDAKPSENPVSGSGSSSGAMSTADSAPKAEPEPEPSLPPLTPQEFRIYNRFADQMEYFVHLSLSHIPAYRC
jgi:hypothetical protein